MHILEQLTYFINRGGKMIDFFIRLGPIYQSLLAGIFTWFVTLLGASLVFFFKETNTKLMNLTLGLSAGIMLSASIFSLIMPALEIANYITVSIGIIVGAIVILLGEKIYEKLLKTSKKDSKKRSFLLITAIFLHNIPEGLILGLSFASLFYNINGVTLASSLMLTLGIGIQNFPEGTAVALPLKREGYSNKLAFFIGQLSGIVEPIFAVIGAALSTYIKSLLPYLLAGAAGAMFYVIICELIPESGKKNREFSTIVTIIGFIVMMILDIAIG